MLKTSVGFRVIFSSFLQEIEGKMRDWRAGSSLVLECSSGGRHNAHLLAVGSKYNTKKVEVFICTKNSGPTANGDPYEAKNVIHLAIKPFDT